MMQQAIPTIAVTLALLPGRLEYSILPAIRSTNFRHNLNRMNVNQFGCFVVKNMDNEIYTEIKAIDPEYKKVFDHEISKLKLDMTLYTVAYSLKYHDGECFYLGWIAYKYKDPRIRGSDPVHPSYEIEISKSDKRLVRVSRAR